MRVISGSKKGLRLASLRNRTVRPTADSTKELIFNVLGQAVAGNVVLDIYAGTGGLGIEALSRGAAKAVFVESARPVQKVIKENLVKVGFLEVSEIMPVRAERALALLKQRNMKFDLVLADPPYHLNLASETVELLDRYDVLADDGWLVIEQSARSELIDSTPRLRLEIRKKRGDTCISFFKHEG